MEQILTILRLNSTWDSVKLSDCLKLLFREILVPAYSANQTSGSDDGNSTNKFVEFFKKHVYPKLEASDFSKRGLASCFEQLVFVHAYVSTVFDSCPHEEFEETVQAVLPPLFTLDNVLRHCTDTVRIKEACNKASDLPTALNFARLTCFQVLKLLWFQAMILIQPPAVAIKK